MPHSHDAERALLGSILLDNSALNAIASIVSPDDLFTESHRLIFRHLTALTDTAVRVDTVTLVEELTRSGELEKAGGAAYIAGLSDGVPIGDYSFIGNYARIIKQKSILRQIVNGSSAVMTRALSGSENPADILADADGILATIKDQTHAISRGVIPIARIISEVIPKLDRASEPSLRPS